MPAETTQTPEAPVIARGGLRSRSFLGLLATQFLGETNNNIFRWLMIPIAKWKVGPEYSDAALAAGAVCVVLPYVLLAAPAGYVADRFSKRNVILGCKLGELVVMLLGVATILIGNLYLMYAVLTLMGCQAAMFAPSKYGCIPEMVRSDRVSAANGLIGLTTVLAIVAGVLTGGYLADLTSPLGRRMWCVPAAVLIGVALIGLTASLLIARLRSANPARTFPFDAPRQTFSDLAKLVSNRALLLVALGATVFWGLGVLGQINIDALVNTDLLARAGEQANQKYVGILQGVAALGIGVGSVLAGLMSRGRIELGIVPVGSAGIALSAILLFAVPHTEGTAISSPYYWSALWLLTLGLSAGMFNVPLQAFLQVRSPEKSRGSILAASNLLICCGMLGASGMFWLCRQPMGLSARAIFLLMGLTLVPVFLFVVWLLPAASVRFVVWLVSLAFYRVRVHGREHLPERGGALLVANHVSWIDGVLMILYCPRPVRVVAVARYVQKGLIGLLANDVGVIPIEPGRKSVVRSIRKVREALRNGDLVCVFPEGGITRDGKIRPFQPGFLSMLKKTAAPVIPVYLGGLWGSIFSFERGKFFWKWPKRWPYPVSIRFGPPIAEPESVEQIHRAVATLGEE